MCAIPEMMRYALANQFLNELFSFLPMMIPVVHYVTPESPRILLAIGRIVASRRSITVSSAAPRRHRHLRCVGTLSAVIALEGVQ